MVTKPKEPKETTKKKKKTNKQSVCNQPTTNYKESDPTTV